VFVDDEVPPGVLYTIKSYSQFPGVCHKIPNFLPLNVFVLSVGGSSNVGGIFVLTGIETPATKLGMGSCSAASTLCALKKSNHMDCTSQFQLDWSFQCKFVQIHDVKSTNKFNLKAQRVVLIHVKMQMENLQPNLKFHTFQNLFLLFVLHKFWAFASSFES
jgi:hypothetical protein